MCEHENSIVVIDFEVNKYWKDRRCYEVAVCPDCNQIFNWAKGNDNDACLMKPMEIVQMFVDLRDATIRQVEEIQGSAEELSKTLEGIIGEMPKVES